MSTSAARPARAAFFDLDGCLVDSRDSITEAINLALASRGLAPVAPESLHRFIGPPLHEAFAQILASVEGDPGDAIALVDAYREVYPELSITKTTPMEGIPEALAALRGRLPLLVVTSKPVEFAEPILEAVGLRGMFGAVFGPTLDALTEPKAVKLESAIAAAGLGPAERRDGVMIGDRMHDVEAGKACGTRTVGVTWGIGDRAELEAAGADAIADRPGDLLGLLA